jgi:hypothetical protein
VSLYASHDDLIELTHYKQPKRQIAALVEMRIAFRVAPDGRPVVLIADLAPDGSRARSKRGGPNYAALAETA